MAYAQFNEVYRKPQFHSDIDIETTNFTLILIALIFNYNSTVDLLFCFLFQTIILNDYNSCLMNHKTQQHFIA